MGYYSQVAYRIRFDDSHTLGLFINYVFGSGNEHMIEALKECEVDFKDYYINFHKFERKWYEGYEYVQGHISLYELCNKEDTPFFDKCGYTFHRVGEEQADIDSFEGGQEPPYDDFYTSTTIEVPFDTNYTPYGDILDELTKQQPTEGEQAWQQ